MAQNPTLRRLKKLANSVPEPDLGHFHRIAVQVHGQGNDSGVAILMASNVENALDAAIMRRLRDKDDRLHDGPLANFSGKIVIGYAIELYGNQTFRNLDIIRQIRNAFAHSRQAIDFESAEVMAAVALLTIPESIPPHVLRRNPIEPNRLTGRQRYQYVCEMLAHNLEIRSIRGVAKLQANALREPLGAGIEAYTREAALP